MRLHRHARGPMGRNLMAEYTLPALDYDYGLIV
jgi:hypothetical protein